MVNDKLDIDLKGVSKRWIPEIVIEFDKKLSHFPDGRIDYSQSDEAPVITCFVEFEEKILILKRSDKVGTYKNKWNAIAGYIDELKPVYEHALKEMNEEIGIKSESISILVMGKPYKWIDKDLNKTWYVHPFLAKVRKKPKIKLDWEHSDYTWIKSEELKKFDVVPHLLESLKNVLNP